ncbi:peptidylprolyl isomerase [Flexivirga alba]|uniref:Peptidyl-prolyl cis-trans isomerase n=1 Tax=Flexivirga alba TaxID=702742 RepID=A0ABW2AJI6_9MICO
MRVGQRRGIVLFRRARGRFAERSSRNARGDRHQAALRKATGAAGQHAAAEASSKADAAGKTFTAVLHTNCGNVTVELYGAKAPQTVASFLQLAKAYWNDSPCHRLTTQGIYVLQCGDPTGTGTGSPGYGFGIENAPQDGDYPAGTLAMARSQDPNSNGGQFFIVYDDTQLPTDGGGYSIFGKIVGGMKIVNAVAKAGTNSPNGDGAPTQPISILKVTVTEKKA